MDRDSNLFGERDEFRSGARVACLRLFDISNVPLLISYASTNINLFYAAENQTGPVLSLSLSLWFSLRETKRNSDPARDNKDSGTFTTDPYNSFHYRQVSLTRLCSFAYEAPTLPLPFLVHGHV